MILSKVVNAVLFGTALGDAWGYPTEFLKFKELLKKDTSIPNDRMIRVTDDTQMSLYNVFALKEWYDKILKESGIEGLNHAIYSLPDSNFECDRLRKIFADKHVMFRYDPDNNRAPGTTVMNATGKYAKLGVEHRMTGMEGLDSMHPSKGCGANMRCSWFGLLDLPETTVATMAMVQAQTTHGHPMAIASSVMTALTVRELSMNSIVYRRNPRLILSMMAIYAERYTDGLYKMFDSLDVSVAFSEISCQISEMDKTYDNWSQHNRDRDINSFFGEGWTADEAFYNALAVVTSYNEHEILEGLERLVVTNGDSDSIAAIGGAFLGAAYSDAMNEALQENRVMLNLEDRYIEELCVASALLSARPQFSDNYSEF